MTDQHPVTPPPKLVQQWLDEWMTNVLPGTAPQYIATRAARWGADQELETCCVWLRHFKPEGYVLSARLRTHRRFKPKSLAEEALKELAWVDKNVSGPLLNKCDAVYTIRRALERLQELEGQQ